VVRRYAFICAHLVCAALFSAAALAQNAPAILPAGDAAVAGFSGTTVIGSPPEPQRIDKTYINLDGPALRVIGLDRLGGPPQGQFVPAAKPFMATARQIGQVFSVALDNADPPNIYAAATSAYGLPIVVPDADGDGVPDRARRGAPNAAFMPGLFGPAINGGGPGSIWKIDGRTGAVSLFANVTLGGVPNSGPALGGLTFDPASRQIFVADRDTGMIHRFTLDGVERGVFDHGTQALPVSGLPPVPFDPRKRINLQNPAFDSTNPATWGYAPPARRVFGLAVNQGRLYYAVAAGLRIWSVALLPDGSFGPDARLELTVPPGAQAGAEVSEILFDGSGDMLLAERGAPTGAYDYEALAQPGESRVLRFRPIAPDDPPSEDFWFPVPKEYAIGFPPNFHNDNGGIAIGYGYDAAGNINRAVCGGALWTSGERLRMSPDPAIARLLQPGGPLAVHGLQGNATAMVQPLNVPPFNSYFIDYYDIGERPAWSGHLGGVAIWRVCPHTQVEPVLWEILTEVAVACPAGYASIRGQCVPSSCPPEQMTPDGKCGQPACKPERRPHAIGIPCCPDGQVANNGRCTTPNGPDLSIDKTIISCTAKGVCKFRITVTNNGPGDYTGPIVVGEDFSSGTLTSNQLISPAGNMSCEPLQTSNLPPNVQQLLPPGDHPHVCFLPNVTLHPGQTVVIEVGGKVNPTLRPSQPRNCAGVIGLPLNEPNYANNGKCVDIPPPKPKYHVDKTGDKSCYHYSAGSAQSNALGGGDIYYCRFLVTVTNDGTVPLSGATFTDTPTLPGKIARVDLSDGSWQCTDPGATGSMTCTRAAGHDIPAGQSATLTVGVVVPAASVVNGVVENCAVPGTTADNTIRPGNLGNLGNISQAVSNALQSAGPGQLSNPAQTGPGIGGFPGGSPGSITPVPCKQIPAGAVSACPDGSQRNSDGNCPTTTSSCPFPTFLVNGTCCTREAIAAGTCGPVVDRCPEGTRRGLNGQCFFVDPGCQGPNCNQVTSCPTAQVLVNGACCNIRDYQAGRCGGTQTSCPFPKLMGPNGQCICRGGTVGDDCHVPPTGSQPTCQSPKTMLFGQCVCRPGTVGDDCHVPPDNKCKTGTHLEDGECVRNRPKPKPKPKRNPKQDKSDNPPVQSAPPLNIQIGPGFPGGRPGGKPGTGPTKGGSGCGARCG
jgi:hypothetical protein